MTPAVTEWLALMRAHEGGVTKLNGRYLNRGRPVAGFLADALGELIRAGSLALGNPDPLGSQRVCVTHAGQVRYAELNSTSTPKVDHGDG